MAKMKKEQVCRYIKTRMSCFDDNRSAISLLSAEKENIETKEEKTAPAEKTSEVKEYRIFEYFKEHTGLLVTCVSALVAIMSFVLRFAVGRMNYSYLAYWNILSLHANTSNQSELDMVVCALLYIFALFLMHGFLGKTAEVYQHYNKFLSVTKVAFNRLKEENERILEIIRSCSEIIDQISSVERDDDRADEERKRINECEAACQEITQKIQHMKTARRRVLRWVVVQIIVSLILSYLFGSIFLFLLNATTPLREGIQLTAIVAVSIIVDLVVYFIPAFFKTRCVDKELTDEEVDTLASEVIREELPEFPVFILLHHGFKGVLTDKNIKKATGYSIAITALLILIITISGTLNAERQQRFSIYNDGTTSYAIVYTSESTRFMEEAVIKDKTITIDTTKQRIITSDDITYTIQEFDEVVIKRIAGEQSKGEEANLEKANDGNKGEQSMP